VTAFRALRQVALFSEAAGVTVGPATTGWDSGVAEVSAADAGARFTIIAAAETNDSAATTPDRTLLMNECPSRPNPPACRA